MKQLKDIPTRQSKRPKIKRYKVYDFRTPWHTIFAYVFAYLGGVILFLYAFISLIAF